MGSYTHSVVLPFTPHEVAAIFRDRNYFAFLDSSRTGPVQGRYSILGWDPEIIFRSKGTRIDICARGEWLGRHEDPISALDRLSKAWAPEPANTVRFAGGAIGYLSYDLFRFLERYENLQAVDDLHLPDCCLAVYDFLLVFDHEAGEWTLRGRGSERALEQRLGEIQRSIPASAAPGGARGFGPPQSNMEKRQYVVAVERALHYIAAGDIYQVNLSQRFSQQVEASPFELFSSLRSVSPSFYGAYLNCGDHVVISSSPELFLAREGSGRTIVDILRATFPGESVSGRPKVRAIQIIDELERTQRHIYAGAIGFMGFNGDLRLNIAIRTMTVIGKRVYYHVGSEIVADSIPENEYEETRHKAAALQQAIAK